MYDKYDLQNVLNFVESNKNNIDIINKINLYPKLDKELNNLYQFNNSLSLPFISPNKQELKYDDPGI